MRENNRRKTDSVYEYLSTLKTKLDYTHKIVNGDNTGYYNDNDNSKIIEVIFLFYVILLRK